MTTRNRLADFLRSDRGTGLAVGIVTVILTPLQLLRVLGVHFAFDEQDALAHPVLASVLLVVGAIFIWAGIQVFDKLFAYWWRDDSLEFWGKFSWFLALLLWPYGPVAYFFAVYRRRIVTQTNPTIERLC